VNLNDYACQCHLDNSKWWHDAEGKPIERNKAELICLMHSELSEAMEAERKGLMDDKLPHRPGVEVELADTLIRIFDYAAAFGLDLEGAYQDKRAFNRTRIDHDHAARNLPGGKKW
jgi:NTP pyrophosphatase (non-canonical NTP hydrolase)